MVSLIIPTYNEKENIPLLIRELCGALEAASIGDYEILVMDDDSPDGTARCVDDLRAPKVRAINRKGKPRGLSNSVIDGFSQAAGDVLGVIDADLSHPPSAVGNLIEAIRSGAVIAVGSRYVHGGGVANWPWTRVFASRVACLLARPVTRVKDPTSGFFFVRKSALSGVHLNPMGFKIGLEVFVKAAHRGKIKEVPYVFTDRRHGQSKLGPGVMSCYLRQLVHLMRYRLTHKL